MNRKRSQWLAIGMMLTTGIASVVLAVVTLAGFPETASGDIAASSMSQAANVVVVLLGSLLLIGLELARTTWHRETPRRIAEAKA